MDWASIFSSTVIIPILTVIVTAVAGYIGYRMNKVSKTAMAKNAMAEMEKKNGIRNQVMDLIQKNVRSAVESNMQLADSMKQAGHKLDQDEIKALNNSAKQMIMFNLPLELTNSDGVLCEIIGGPDKLDSIIDTMMEQAVYEIKLKKLQVRPSNELPQTLQDAIAEANKPKITLKPKKK